MRRVQTNIPQRLDLLLLSLLCVEHRSSRYTSLATKAQRWHRERLNWSMAWIINNARRNSASISVQCDHPQPLCAAEWIEIAVRWSSTWLLTPAISFPVELIVFLCTSSIPQPTEELRSVTRLLWSHEDAKIRRNYCIISIIVIYFVWIVCLSLKFMCFPLSFSYTRCVLICKYDR